MKLDACFYKQTTKPTVYTGVVNHPFFNILMVQHVPLENDNPH